MAVKAVSAGDSHPAAHPEPVPPDPTPADPTPADPTLPDPAQRPSHVSGVLCDRQVPPAGAEAVVAACAALLARHLQHLADWTATGWKVGDNNRYTLVTAFEDGLELVVTLMSEPLEEVRWRLTAGGVEGALFGRGRRDQLQRFGFAPAGDGLGWERDVRIASPRDAAIAARDLLALLTEVFGFCARAPLTFALAHDQRAEPGLLYKAITPDDLRKLLHSWGYRAEVGTTSSGGPVIRSGTSGYKFHILFAWPGADSRLFGCLNFVTVFTGRQYLTLTAVNDISRSSRFGRLYLDDDGDLILERDVSLTGGVAANYLHECLLDWACMMESVTKKLDKFTKVPVVVH